ncbi:MAG: CoA transferase, partial [Chloroflexi bacterium]|nr:CoA transferase [Chloroflexota bacterium]
MPGVLDGLTVVELADEQAEFCGLSLAGLGATVVKVEPPGGSPTRRIGPFYQDREDPERSLFFWQYNRGKHSVVLDLASDADRERMLSLLDSADVFLESTPTGQLASVALGHEELRRRCPQLIVARMTAFGDDGPWAGFKGSDLIHLALGGVMMNCGYDPRPDGTYELPPIAPQMWHAYHIAGEQLLLGILAALLYRQRTGQGQVLTCAIHEAVNKCTEADLMSWILRRAPFFRQACRHAAEAVSQAPTIGTTQDGRWIMAAGSADSKMASFLERFQLPHDLVTDEAPRERGRRVPGTAADSERTAHATELVHRLMRRFTYDTAPWREGQEAGFQWTPLRKPHENALDQHWLSRGTYADVEHPEIDRTLRYPVSKWLSSVTAWQPGRRAPLLNEDAGLTPLASQPMPIRAIPSGEQLSPLGKPFPLAGVRILDFTWFLASAGATRFLTAFGAESIKVEWSTHPDTRLAAQAPLGGREARERATAPLPPVNDADMGGQFNNKNPGKRGLSLNVTHPKGLDIAKRLVALSDIVAEGFSPGVMDRWGLGYDVLRSIRPDIIYAQQSGWGSRGTYGRMRATGPIAASFAGLSEMSGLPEPAMPVGWGYSYLDWMGAYSFGLAIMSALYHRNRTGEGQWLDASQCEAGLYINGTAVLDWSAHGRVWSRYGNRSPYKPAAPHGAFRCRGQDRWLAIACFDEDEWRSLAEVAGHLEWLDDGRFRTLTARLAHQDALEEAVSGWTTTQEAYAAMERLQAAGVPAGVCQTAEDRCEHDPQLAHLRWLTELNGTK